MDFATMLDSEFTPHPRTSAPRQYWRLPKENAALRLPRAFLVTFFCFGFALFASITVDLCAQLPENPSDLLWQISFLEQLYSRVTLLALGVIAMVTSPWLASLGHGHHSQGLNRTLGFASVLIGVCLLASVPLYGVDLRRVYQIKSVELHHARAQVGVMGDAEWIKKLGEAKSAVAAALVQRGVRSATGAVLMGGVLLLCGAFAWRQTREDPDTGIRCPKCLSHNIQPPAMLSETERSLGYWTRIHTFECGYCDHRFRKLSLTGKPFRFFF